MTPMSTTAVLQAHALGKAYGRTPVLRGIDLQVPSGTILGLVGRNGAGKTTLLECLLGLRLPDQGRALLFGKPVLDIDDDDKAALGYVAQQPEGFDWMTVRDMLALMSDVYPTWDETLSRRLLDSWQLPDTGRLLSLSPGQRQQVAIIRALAPRPRLLVLDEPASALDPLARRALLKEVAMLAAEAGSSVVFSTHIVSDLERVATHVALLHQGRLQIHVPLDELKEQWRRVCWTSPALLPGEVSRRPLPEGGWSVLLRVSPPLHDSVPAEARLLPLSLEDVLVELAG